MGGYVLTRYHLTDVPGVVDQNSAYYAEASVADNTAPQSASVDALSLDQITSQIQQLQLVRQTRLESACKLPVIAAFAGDNYNKILATYAQTNSNALEDKMISAVDLRLQGNPQYASQVVQCTNVQSPAPSTPATAALMTSSTANAFQWFGGDKWQTVQDALTKDSGPITQAANQAGIEPRLLVSNIFVEQMRLYNTEREYFKQYFSPLKIFATTNMFTWGVTSIKEQTAIQIENNLKDSSSPYYLGPQYEHLLDFTTDDPATERYNRLTDMKNHYYSYLYAALYIRELEQQWKNAGYPINYRPEIIATLYNISFAHSHPNADPQVGGSTLIIDNTTYSFGGLAYEYYYSGEMTNLFPYTKLHQPAQ